MGGSKAKKRPEKKVKHTVPTQFDCPFCNHNKTVECKLNRQTSVGKIHCRICDASYSMPINYLSNPIDVFSDWIDKCEEQNRAAAARADGSAGAGAAAGAGRRTASAATDRDKPDSPTATSSSASASASSDAKDQKAAGSQSAGAASGGAAAAAADGKTKPAAKPAPKKKTDEKLDFKSKTGPLKVNNKRKAVENSDDEGEDITGVSLADEGYNSADDADFKPGEEASERVVEAGVGAGREETAVGGDDDEFNADDDDE